MMFTIQDARVGQSAICAPILRALPEWFGREEANQHYIDFVENHPTFVAYDGERAVGFLSLEQHYPQSAEIYVMGVLPEMHRKGVGQMLIAVAEEHLRANGTTFLQVKTLGEAHPDEGYQRTRAFYRGVGFIPLEEFEDLWGANTPALQLIKVL